MGLINTVVSCWVFDAIKEYYWDYSSQLNWLEYTLVYMTSVPDKCTHGTHTGQRLIQNLDWGRTIGLILCMSYTRVPNRHIVNICYCFRLRPSVCGHHVCHHQLKYTFLVTGTITCSIRCHFEHAVYNLYWTLDHCALFTNSYLLVTFMILKGCNITRFHHILLSLHSF